MRKQHHLEVQRFSKDGFYDQNFCKESKQESLKGNRIDLEREVRSRAKEREILEGEGKKMENLGMSPHMMTILFLYMYYMVGFSDLSMSYHKRFF